MGKQKYQVSDEVALRWVERRLRGDSFSKIGADEGFPRRFVAKVIQRYEMKGRIEESAVARRNVRAEFLKEHLQELETVAYNLLGITAAPSLWGKLFVTIEDIEDELLASIEKSLGPPWSGEVKVAGGWEDFKEKLQRRQTKHHAKAVIEDLKEHMPDVWPEVKVWEQTALRYTESWRQLEKQTKDIGVAPELIEPGIREALNLMSTYEAKDNPPRTSAKPETASDVALWLFRTPPLRKSLELFRRHLESLEAAYRQLEDILNPLELRKALLERRCRHCPLP